ncbi:sigma-70 family RNA polymerase sigma factor [Patescibacteria group bacterium]|nr:sigma-70 family RNA polymerase sigma factor [Patescibacteria group bacterium]
MKSENFKKSPRLGTVFEQYVRDVSRYPILDLEEQQELARRYRQHGDQRAIDRLINCNLRFVIKMASRYSHFGLPIMDLIQQGNLGLIKSAQKNYDPEKGFKLLTIAEYAIRGAIFYYIRKNWSLTKVFFGQQGIDVFNIFMSKRYAKVVQEVNGCGLDVAEAVSAEFGISKEDYSFFLEELSISRWAVSFDGDSDSESDSHYSDFQIASSGNYHNGIEDSCLNALLQENRTSLFLCLLDILEVEYPERAEVMRSRYFIPINTSPEGFRQLGLRLGYSYGRTQQMEEEVIVWLRNKIVFLELKSHVFGTSILKQAEEERKTVDAFFVLSAKQRAVQLWRSLSGETASEKMFHRDLVFLSRVWGVKEKVAVLILRGLEKEGYISTNNQNGGGIYFWLVNHDVFLDEDNPD